MKLHHSCFARVHTFGKACGVHGAIVLGSNDLRNYLINFARPFIFSTALPAASIHSIKSSYQLLPKLNTERKQLDKLIDQFQFSLISGQRASNNIIHTSCIQHSTTPIQVVIIPGNEEVKKIAIELQKNDLDVRAILYPTVPKGSERLRIVLHSFNTTTEVSKLAEILTKNIF
jgi:8-amino-7-oxononanoate synthase